MSNKDNRNNSEITQRIESETIKKYSRVMQAAGELRVFNQLIEFSMIAAINTFNEVRESKAYKGLPHTDANGNHITIRTIQQFCSEIIGVSYSKLMEENDRLNDLGEAGYLSLNELGLKRSQLRLVDKLPDDDKAVIKLALDADNKDALEDLLEETLTRNTKENKKLKREVQDAANRNKDFEDILADKNKQVDALNIKLDRRQSTEAEVVIEEMSNDLIQETEAVLAELLGFEKMIGEVMFCMSSPRHLKVAALSSVDRIRTALNDLYHNHQLDAITVDGVDDDAWMDEASKTGGSK